MIVWAVVSTLVALGAIMLLVRDEWRALFRLRSKVPLFTTRLRTVEAYRVLDSPDGQLLLLDLARSYLFREAFVANDAYATARNCGEAGVALRLFRMASRDTRGAILETLLTEETRNA